MRQFRLTFLVWFVSLMVLFVCVNLAGFVLHGSKQHSIGYPFSIVHWIEIGDESSEREFTASAIFSNAAVAVGVSTALATICAMARIYQVYQKAK